MTQHCPYDEKLLEFLYEEMSAEEARDFSAHLSGCALCQKQIEGLRQVRKAFRELPVPTVEEDTLQRMTAQILQQAQPLPQPRKPIETLGSTGNLPSAEVGKVLKLRRRTVRSVLFHPAAGIVAAAAMALVYVVGKGWKDEPVIPPIEKALAPAAPAPAAAEAQKPETAVPAFPALSREREAERLSEGAPAPQSGEGRFAQPPPEVPAEEARTPRRAAPAEGDNAAAGSHLADRKAEKKQADGFGAVSGAAGPQARSHKSAEAVSLDGPGDTPAEPPADKPRPPEPTAPASPAAKPQAAVLRPAPKANLDEAPPQEAAGRVQRAAPPPPQAPSATPTYEPRRDPAIEGGQDLLRNQASNQRGEVYKSLNSWSKGQAPSQSLPQAQVDEDALQLQAQLRGHLDRGQCREAQEVQAKLHTRHPAFELSPEDRERLRLCPVPVPQNQLESETIELQQAPGRKTLAPIDRVKKRAAPARK